MNRNESVSILSILKTAYPSFYKNMEEEEAYKTIELWGMMFQDDNPKVVVEAVKALITVLRFPPTIADVKEKISLITQPKSISEMEAWALVLKGIKKSTYHADEEFAKLPADIQKMLGGAYQLREWACMDFETVNSVIQSNFMRSYKAECATNKEHATLPASTRSLMDELKERGPKFVEGG